VLRNEDGIALVMALGIMMVLTLALGTVIYMTAAGARNAKHTNAGQKAYALAEAGLNNVLAQVAANYPNSAIAGNSAWAASPAGGPVTYDGGTVTWGGQFEGTGCPSNTWCLTGSGTAKNPTGVGAADVVRTVKARITVSAAPPPYIPYGLFSGDPTAQCTILQGGVSINVPVYVASCLTLAGNADSPPAPTSKAKVWEQNTPATVTVQVGGLLTLNGGTTIGTAAKNVKLISAGSCSPSPCNAANGFYGPLASPPLTPVPSATVNASTVYSAANWPGATCTTGANPFDNNSVRNGSLGTVGPETWTTFDCSVTDAQGAVHRLAYNSATRTMTIQGSVFIDGNFTSSPNKGFSYTGNGTIYFNGTVTHSGVICGPGSSWTTPGTCGKTWDLTSGALLLVACNASATPVSPSFTVQSQAIFEAGAWAVGTSSTTSPAFESTGNAYLGGSVFTEKGYASIAGGGVLHAFVSMPSGAPTAYIYTLASHPTSYSGG
jgi:Tfp pilus assembly protein PilX